MYAIFYTYHIYVCLTLFIGWFVLFVIKLSKIESAKNQLYLMGSNCLVVLFSLFSSVTFVSILALSRLGRYWAFFPF